MTHREHPAGPSRPAPRSTTRSGQPDDAIEVARRAYLRYPVVADEAEFVRLMRLSRRLHRPWVSTMDRDDFLRYLARAQRPDVEAVLVCRRDDAAVAGFINLTQIFYGGFRNAVCGYAAFTPSAGQGYLAEGLGMTLRHAFSTLGLHRVEANIQPGNDRSRLLAEEAGFRVEGFSPRFLKIGGRWRDHERWAVTAEDWRQRRRLS
jgi:[ribosomal protein S5]-alanine N-acetyltransferase